MYYIVNNDYLAHHGILGQKWGVRRYQNHDGTLTKVGLERYGKKIRRIEQQAINKHYKEQGRGFVFKSARTSTGKNFDEAVDKFHKEFNNDKEYDNLEKAAHEAEKKRLLAEKAMIGQDEEYPDYNTLYKNKDYKKLLDASVSATNKLDEYINKKVNSYVDTIKDAKIKDLNITENIDIAKKFLKNNFKYDLEPKWSGNLQYNPDNYYESWVDKAEYKKRER